MRYIVFLFFLFQIPLREITHQSLWESGKVPLPFAGLFHFPIGLEFTGLYPQILLKNQIFFWPF
jgi:hypothetical protein